MENMVRQAFERWFCAHFKEHGTSDKLAHVLTFDTRNNRYASFNVEMCWQAWNAALEDHG